MGYLKRDQRGCAWILWFSKISGPFQHGDSCYLLYLRVARGPHLLKPLGLSRVCRHSSGIWLNTPGSVQRLSYTLSPKLCEAGQVCMCQNLPFIFSVEEMCAECMSRLPLLSEFFKGLLGLLLWRIKWKRRFNMKWKQP